MAHQLTALVDALRMAKPTWKAVLFSIADKSNDADVCAWPKIKRICQEKGFARTAVKKALAELQAAGKRYDDDTGYLLVSRGDRTRGFANLYWIDWEKLVEDYGIYDYYYVGGRRKPDFDKMAPYGDVVDIQDARARANARKRTRSPDDPLPSRGSRDDPQDGRQTTPRGSRDDPQGVARRPPYNEEPSNNPDGTLRGEPARVAAGAAGEADADARQGKIGALWWSKRAELEAHPEEGTKAWGAWLWSVTPLDDGELYVLAVPNQVFRQTIVRRYGDWIAEVLGRKVAFEVVPWAMAAAEKRRAKEERDKRQDQDLDGERGQA